MAQVELRAYARTPVLMGLIVLRLYPPEPGPGGIRFPSRAHLEHPFRLPRVIGEWSV